MIPTRPALNRPSGRTIASASIGIATIAIFIGDTITDYAIAAAVFYTTVILAAVCLFRPRAVIALSCLCVVLTVASFGLTHDGSFDVGAVNTGISIVAIGVTTYLGLRLVTAEAATHEARARLVRIARVTSLGQLTGSIAHEVNQPLAAIVTSGQACARWLAQDPPNLDKARGALARVIDDANRASDVIARIRRLSRGKPSEKSDFDLKEAVLEIVALSQSEIDRQGITLSLGIVDDLPPVFADRVQVQQVIGNLLLNAIEAAVDASDRRNEITISLESETGFARFSIADTGAGLSQAACEHLFDAFWTTKVDGVGLGLTICRTIIETNAGEICATTTPGGAVLSFTLPIRTRNHENDNRT